MIKIDFKNIQCLKSGNIKIKEKYINVKYSYNGFGKSSLAKAICYKINNDGRFDDLKPFLGGQPEINGLSTFNKCLMFNEEFVDNTLFENDENLIANSYNVFLNSEELSHKNDDISKSFLNLNNSLKSPIIESFLNDIEKVLSVFVLNKEKNGFDGRKTGGKGLNKVSNITRAALETSVKDFKEIANDGKIPLWLEWHKNGENFVYNNKCPFCISDLRKENQQYKIDIDDLLNCLDSKNNEKARKHIEIFSNYLSKKEKEIVLGILDDGKLQDDKKIVLIKNIIDFENEYNKIIVLKSLEKNWKKSRTDSKKIKELLASNILNDELFKKIDSKYAKICHDVNDSIKEISNSIDELSELIAQRNLAIDDAVADSEKEIDAFLKNSGIPYSFSITAAEENEVQTSLKVSGNTISNVRNHLSYGEKNALSVALFGALAKKDDSDLIILDDPISSFDENKKFAIMYYLFNKSNGVLNDKTVLLFTHDFEPVLEMMKGIVDKRIKNRKIYVLNKQSGIVDEEELSSSDLVNAIKKEYELSLDQSIDTFLRIVHIRRYYELCERSVNKDVYNLLSNAEHLREIPIDENGDYCTKDSVENAEKYIKIFINDFSYSDFVKKYDIHKLLSIYNSEVVRINKLIILRAIDAKSGGFLEKNEPVLFNFITTNYHVENMYAYSIKKLDPIPEYIIGICDSFVKNMKDNI